LIRYFYTQQKAAYVEILKEGAKQRNIIDPLHQLINLFSQSALTERRFVYVCVVYE